MSCCGFAYPFSLSLIAECPLPRLTLEIIPAQDDLDGQKPRFDMSRPVRAATPGASPRRADSPGLLQEPGGQIPTGSVSRGRSSR